MNNQPLQSNMETYPRKNFWQRNALSIKIILIGVLILLLLIPVSMIKGLITERATTADDATEEVQRKWSGAQDIVGPVLSIPYLKRVEEEVRNNNIEVKIKKQLDYLNILPETLDIEGNITTQELKRGLYQVVVYNTPLRIKGKFVLPENFASGIPAEDLYLNEATLNIGISDLRGISEQVKLQWGEENYFFNPGTPKIHILNSGVSSPVNMEMFRNKTDNTVGFDITLHLKGSQSLMFAPLGKTTTVDIKSNCPTPSFTGSFLPANRTVEETGFSADWKVLNLNRNYPQIFTGSYSSYADWSTFGVDLLLPVHQYQKSMRTVKYAFLIIILTFVVSFFVEIIHKKHIHPFQYLLVGLALCLFYTLLIAISEHIHFGLAYLIAAVMTVILITLYMIGILKIRKTAITIGSLLTVLYGYIFILIQMETYALLAGSIGLFVMLAIIMYYSQKINWENQNI